MNNSGELKTRWGDSGELIEEVYSQEYQELRHDHDVLDEQLKKCIEDNLEMKRIAKKMVQCYGKEFPVETTTSKPILEILEEFYEFIRNSDYA